MKFRIIILLFLIVSSCSDEDNKPTPVLETFFPQDNVHWERVDPVDLGWDINELDNFYSYLESNNTRAFIVLVNGRIAKAHKCGFVACLIPKSIIAFLKDLKFE